MPGRWDYTGSAEMTEYWRRVVPALSVRTDEDRSDVDNDRWRVRLVRERYALELKHIGASGNLKLATSRLTRLCEWSALTPQERSTGRRDSPFALCRGVPSGLSFQAHTQPQEGLDFAVLISVPPELLPSGPLFLEGVPIVVQAHHRFRPVPGNADERWPPEPAR